MRCAVLTALLATVLASCGGHSSSLPSSTRTSPGATADAATLLARPLKLPVVRSGSACPVTPVSSRKIDVTNPRGHGPFYLGGPMPQGNVPWNKNVWVLADRARGPLLFPGGRVDGTGSLKVNG